MVVEDVKSSVTVARERYVPLTEVDAISWAMVMVAVEQYKEYFLHSEEKLFVSDIICYKNNLKYVYFGVLFSTRIQPHSFAKGYCSLLIDVNRSILSSFETLP